MLMSYLLWLLLQNMIFTRAGLRKVTILYWMSHISEFELYCTDEDMFSERQKL
jgi:hypothetical protein